MGDKTTQIYSTSPPVSYLYDWMKNKRGIEIWPYEPKSYVYQGLILGFDEHMNIVLGNAFKLYKKTMTSHILGKTLIKGDSIGVILAI